MYLYALHLDGAPYAATVAPPMPPSPTVMTTPKRVHFAETNVVYSAPATPSPTLSELSLPSSPDPPTPALFDQKAVITTTTCSPSLQEQEQELHPPEAEAEVVEVHDLLRADVVPPLRHDLNAHPSYITTTPTPHRPLAPHELAQPATTPPRALLHLVAHRFPWTIAVVPGITNNNDNNNGDGGKACASACVTVLDVLATLHRALRLPVTQAEYDGLPTHEDVRGVCAAYEARCAALADPAARWEEERKGVKRVDFLLGRTFLGLSRTHMGDDVWLVNVQ